MLLSTQQRGCTQCIWSKMISLTIFLCALHLFFTVCCAQAPTHASVHAKVPVDVETKTNIVDSSTVSAIPTHFETTNVLSELLPGREMTTPKGRPTGDMPVFGGAQTSGEERAVVPAAPTSAGVSQTESMTTSALKASSDIENSSLRSLAKHSLIATSTELLPTEATTAAATRPQTRSRFLESIRGLVKQLMNTAGDRLYQTLMVANVSAACTRGTLEFMSAIQELEPWAIRLFDATAKYPTGFFQATAADLGAYDECIETVVWNKNGSEKVRGQYCSVHLSALEGDNFVEQVIPAFEFSHKRARSFQSFATDKRLPGLRFGLCFISSCSAEDLTRLGHTLTGNTADIVVENCVTSVADEINNAQAGIIAFLAVLVTVIIAATIFDLLTEDWDENRKNAVSYKCVMAFSALANTRLILNDNRNKDSDNYSYRFMHGIRFLSIFWVCLGHCYGTINGNLSRLINALHYFEHWETMIVTGGYFAVDTFFLLSGFLLYYTLSKQHRNRAVVAVVATIRRYIRATVPLFFMIMCMYLLPLIASGPNSEEFFKKFYTEMRNHWWDLLFQMRNWRAEQELSTMPHVWYLSADFQFFIFAVLIIQTLKTKKRLVACAFALLSLVCCGISAWEIYGTRMTPFIVAVTGDISVIADTINYYYLHPFYHAVCFFSGCITYLLVEKYGKAKISKVILASLWCIGLSCGLYCMFMKHAWYRSSERATESKRMFYAFTDRIFWSVCVAWFVFACATGRGGIVNRFLSWDGFIPLSRLSFGVYLIHSPFMILMYHISREHIFYSHFTLVSQCFVVLVWSYILSYFLFIACDAPTGHLEKLVFMRDRRAGTLQTGEAVSGASNGISSKNNSYNDNVRDVPVGILENGTMNSYLNEVSPPLGDEKVCDSSFAGKCCRL